MTIRTEDYLLVIWEHREAFGSITGKDIADRLKISQPTVSEYLGKIEQAGLLRKDRSHIELTPEGLALASHATRMHRLSEVFAYRMLEIPWEETHSSVMELEHLFEGPKGDKLFKNLGYPETCPHGNPTNPERKITEVSLPDAPDGKYRLARVCFEEKNLLRDLANLNILPGTEITVINGDDIVIEGESGSMRVRKDLHGAIKLASLEQR